MQLWCIYRQLLFFVNLFVNTKHFNSFQNNKKCSVSIHLFQLLLYNITIPCATHCPNFEIRCDVTSGRLRTSLWVTIKRPCFVVIPYTTHVFYGFSLEKDILLEETSLLISKLDRVQELFTYYTEFAGIWTEIMIHPHAKCGRMVVYLHKSTKKCIYLN